MDAQRFDALVRALGPASRRVLLGGTIGSMLGVASLALDHDEGSAARRHGGNNRNNNRQRRRRRRRNRRQTWTFRANLSHNNESPPSSGDQFSNGSNARIQIVQRRRRFQICGRFNYFTNAVGNSQINVRDVILQLGNTRNNTPAEITFSGWAGGTTNGNECLEVGRSQANYIRRNATDFFVNIRTRNPNHPNGAVAGLLERR
jgi:hypothetical protein